MASRTIFPALLLSVVPLVIGCSANVSSHQREVGFAPTLNEVEPADRVARLRSIAEAGVEGATETELGSALAALEQIEGLEGESQALNLWQARILFFLVEPMSDDEEDEVLRLCRRGEVLAERLRIESPDSVEGHYFGAIFLGLRARHQQLRAAFFLGDLERLGLRAVELDQSYDDAGPLRFLGMLLVSAPSWPYGPGDPDEGVELLQRAVQIDEYPLNRVLLARGLVENGDDELACDELNRAYSSPSEGRWAITRDRWRRDVEQLAARISCEVSTRPGYARAE